jgi:hypothetical protein
LWTYEKTAVEKSMDGYRHAILPLVLVGLFCLSGASCPVRTPFYTQPPNPVLPPTATLEQVIQVVNRNSLQIQSIFTNNATLSVSGFPTLDAQIAFERPRRFRMRAALGFGGAPELDLGSNDDLFWFWVRRAAPPAVYYCRHDQFETCRARNLVPIRPEWLIEALGVNELDPNVRHQGPKTLPDGRLEICTIRETADGPTTKITIVDPVRGLVAEQHMYGPQGQLLVSAVTVQQRQDPLTALFVPQVVEMQVPAAQFSMRIDLGGMQVNRLAGNPAALWSLPSGEGPLVDLCSPNLQMTPSAGAAAVAPGGISRRAAPNRVWSRLQR